MTLIIKLKTNLCIESAAYPAPGNTAFQVLDSGANEAERDLIEGQETAIIFLTEPESNNRAPLLRFLAAGVQ